MSSFFFATIDERHLPSRWRSYLSVILSFILLSYLLYLSKSSMANLPSNNCATSLFSGNPLRVVGTVRRALLCYCKSLIPYLFWGVKLSSPEYASAALISSDSNWLANSRKFSGFKVTPVR